MQWDKKFLSDNRNIPLLCLIFADTRKLVKRWRVPPRKVSVPWEKNQQNCHTPIIQKKLTPERSWNTEWDPYEYFWYCETKNLQAKIVIYPFMLKKISIPKINETIKCSPAKSFGTRRQKELTKSCYSFYPEKLDNRTFLKHRMFPLWIFSVLWDKNNSSKKRDIPLKCLKVFETRN